MESIEQRKFRAADAKALLDNKILNDAFNSVAEHLEQKALFCDPDNKEQAQRVILAKQILAGIKREIVRLVEDGEVAEIQLREIEKTKGILRRFVR